MKTYNFDICKYHVTITIEKKPYKTAKETKDTFEYYGIDTATGVNTFGTMNIADETEEIKMEDPECLCFMEAAEKYIDSKRGELKASTIKGYENIICHHFNDLWLIWLDKLTEEHLQCAFDNEIEKGLSEKTLKGYKSFILKVLAVYCPDFTPEIRIEKESTDETT